ncbi:unnamed protein product [Nezara viridula]|uniref:Uncharacterized protein n=1 Tax=Nezara viridula TaxID=85310 RepID=A0A9P0H7L1_NEZVI|nr:unnamed protein product [Nezara viridula]
MHGLAGCRPLEDKTQELARTRRDRPKPTPQNRSVFHQLVQLVLTHVFPLAFDQDLLSPFALVINQRTSTLVATVILSYLTRNQSPSVKDFHLSVTVHNCNMIRGNRNYCLPFHQ